MISVQLYLRRAISWSRGPGYLSITLPGLAIALNWESYRQASDRPDGWEPTSLAERER